MTRAKKSSKLVRQLRLFLKPCWESPIRLLPSRFVIIFSLINLSIVLQLQMWDYWSVVSRFLYVSRFVNCSDIGRLPICRDYSCFCWFVKDVVYGSTEHASRVHRTLGSRRSDPVDLCTLRWFSFSRTSSCLKMNVSSVLPTYLGSYGMLFNCSWVNTELNYVLRVLAMSLSVVTIWPVGVLSALHYL